MTLDRVYDILVEQSGAQKSNRGEFLRSFPSSGVWSFYAPVTKDYVHFVTLISDQAGGYLLRPAAGGLGAGTVISRTNEKLAEISEVQS